MQRIATITSVRLNSNGIGALFIKDLIAGFEGSEFLLLEERPFLTEIGTLRKSRLINVAFLILQRLSLFTYFRLGFYKAFWLDRRTRSLANQLTAAGIQEVWITSSSVELVWLAHELMEKGFKIRLMVWDAPEYLSTNLRLCKQQHSAFIRTFDALVPKVTSLAVISEAMRQRYCAKYGIDSVIIKHGIDVTEPLRGKKSKSSIRIIFSGSLYAKKEWNALLEAMDSCGWRLAGRRVYLYFVGKFPLKGANTSKNVIRLGERSFEETMKLIARMDIGYVPYWFSSDYELVARTSFPGKVSAYTAGGVNIFHHAPSYTEVCNFLKTYPFGVTCESYDTNSIIECMNKVATHHTEQHLARCAALAHELSKQAMAGRFRNFLR